MYKIALLTRTKNRNHYINFFINYYKALNVDKIFLVDNNDDNNSVKKYLNNCDDKICVFNKKETNIREINEYKQVYYFMSNIIEQGYDYIMSFDDDEFLYLQNYNDIHNLINDYSQYDILYFIWKTYNDNNYVFNDELPNDIGNVIGNFTTPINDSLTKDKINNFNNEFYWTKYIVKCSYLKLFKCPQNKENVFLHKINFNDNDNIKLFYDEYEQIHLKHYRTKNFEEYLLNKIINDNVFYNKNLVFRNNSLIDNYKIFNDIDETKLEKIKLCLNKYKKY